MELGFAMAFRFSSPINFCLSLCFCLSGFTTARTASGGSQDDAFWKSVLSADVVYVGETHNDAADHRYELELIRGLLKRKIHFAIGWEMFDQTQQSAIDAWSSHSISLNEMLTRTDFQRRWGIYSRTYEQILKLTDAAHVRNLALNASPEVVHKIAEGQSLTKEERAAMPAGFKTREKAYSYFLSMMGSHPGINDVSRRRFFAAQNVWDQTMATRILHFKLHNPNTSLVVIAGRGHVSGGFGIPSYVRQKANLRQLVLLPEGHAEPASLVRRSVAKAAWAVLCSPFGRCRTSKPQSPHELVAPLASLRHARNASRSDAGGRSVAGGRELGA